MGSQRDALFHFNKKTAVILLMNVAFLPLAYSDSQLVTDRVTEFSFYPSYVNDQTLSNPFAKQLPAVNSGDETVFANTRFRVTKEKFSFEVEPELRVLHSSHSLSVSSRSSVHAPSRIMGLDWKAGSDLRTESTYGFERLNLDYHSEVAELSVGRKPVSLGVLSVFPVWNKFTRPLMTDFGPLRVFSQDQASFRIQQGSFAFQATDIEEKQSSGAARLAEVAAYGESQELHLLGGQWWQHAVGGLAAVKDLAGTSVRTEGLWVSQEGVQAGLGAERALSETWSVLTEFLYVGNGAPDKKFYLTLPYSRFRPLTAQGYGYARLEYKPSALWTFQLGSLLNFIDSSQLVNGKIIYSLSNDAELTLELRDPIGENGSELSKQVLPVQLIAGLKWTF